MSEAKEAACRSPKFLIFDMAQAGAKVQSFAFQSAILARFEACLASGRRKNAKATAWAMASGMLWESVHA
jgi:hypothetical protein